ncbi:MAG TPA: hypothetical protein VFO16_15180 [Pseudonocardiaceae bacterium]|nr:hypothetical protein [Pseudonocardiaceae bacterium]
MLSTSFDSGIEPKTLSDRVGHSNPTVTFQIYAHRSTGRDRAAAELIGRLIEEAVSGSAGTSPTASDKAVTTVFTTSA